MSIAEYHAQDLRGLVNSFDEHGVFRPGEREAWDDEIDDAEDNAQSLMYLNESLIDAMDDRDGVEEAKDEHLSPEKQFV